MAIIDRVREAIEARNLSVRKVSAALGIPNSTLSRQLTNGGLDIEHAVKIAVYLGLSLDELAELDAPPTPVVTADEQTVLDVLRALRLPKDEAIRRLTGHNGIVAVPIDPARPPVPYPDPARGIGRVTGHPATATMTADASKRRAK